MSKQPRRWAYLDPNCELGKMALAHRLKMGGSEPRYMRLTGDGYVAFSWREYLPEHTQQEHFTDPETGAKYDEGEYPVPIIRIVRESAA